MSNANNRRSRQQNQPSILLSNSENQQLFDIIGGRSVTLASAVVQIYVAPGPNYSQWTKKCCGVACFIKDNGKRSYFIRVFNLSTRGMIWEQELYNQFKYRMPRPFFHTFDAQDSPIGLNFANEEEANRFRSAVTEKLKQREQRKIERKKTQHGARSPPVNAPPPMARSAPEISSPSVPSMPNFSKNDTLGRKGKEKDKKNKGKKGRITKEDIGTPTDFRHVGHVGWDPDTGFDMNNLDPSLKKLFDTVGISDHQLKDKETAKFIYDFIDQHGGLEAVKREQQFPAPPAPPSSNFPPPPPPPSRNVMPPSVPSGPPPPPPSRSPAGPPPPPPSRMNRGMGMAPPPPPPSRSEPPPPPSRNMPPPPPPAFSSPSGPPPPPPPGPPPPPPPGPPPPPAPGMPPPPPVAGGDGRGALLDQIRAGKSLQHVDHSAAPAPPSSDPRSQLLDQIRGGMALKKVEQTERPKSDEGGGEGIAAALAMALANRADVIQGESDSDADEDDDEEWED